MAVQPKQREDVLPVCVDNCMPMCGLGACICVRVDVHMQLYGSMYIHIDKYVCVR